MREWVVKLLGGFTASDVEQAEKDAYDLIGAIEVQHSFLTAQIQRQDQEIQRLTNLMLTRAGFIVHENQVQEPVKHAPINTRSSWPQKQRALELADANKHADEVERRWKAKSGAVLDGDQGDGTGEGGNLESGE
jgi:hypothetical protein